MNTLMRRQKIEELRKEIDPLMTEKVMLAAKLSVEVSVEKENDTVYMAERDKDHSRYHDLIGQLQPLLDKLRALQCLYGVRYSGVYKDGWHNYVTEEFSDNLLCFTDIQLDTFHYGWKTYLEVPTLNELLKEISILLLNRYQSTTIIGVRRLDVNISEEDFKNIPR